VFDQGAALRSICDKYDGQQFFCQRHVLSGMKGRKCKYQIRNLILCKGQTGCDSLRELHFSNIKAAFGADEVELMRDFWKAVVWAVM
jgi:hypothetical protein